MATDRQQTADAKDTGTTTRRTPTKGELIKARAIKRTERVEAGRVLALAEEHKATVCICSIVSFKASCKISRDLTLQGDAHFRKR